MLQARLWQNQTNTYGTLIPDNSISLLLGLVRTQGLHDPCRAMRCLRLKAQGLRASCELAPATRTHGSAARALLHKQHAALTPR